MSKKTKIIILAASAAIAAGIYYKTKITLADSTELSTTKKVAAGALLGLAFSSFALVVIDLVKK